MFGKIKKYLGIEGVKVEVFLPDMAFEEVGAVSGHLVFTSKTAQTVTSVKLKLVEKYSRGRGKEKLTDEYVLGEITLHERIQVPAEEPLAVEFTLPFELSKSSIEKFGDKNFLTGGLVKLANTMRNVQSEYRVEAQAEVEGTALDPFSRKALKMRKA